MKLAAILILFLSFGTAKGQYVAIPDSNFRQALISKGFSSCFDSTLTLLDTTCNSILDSTILIISNRHISSLEGVQYFKHLSKLDCRINLLQALPQLPNTLTDLHCEDNYLTTLSHLPNSLDSIFCQQNSIDTLSSLPDSLLYVELSYNRLRNLPSLPSSLTYLGCFSDSLSTFPPLPNRLKAFNCGGHSIQSFPVLPPSLRYFYCVGANVNALPLLPDSLLALTCSGNPLHTLPTLPNTIHFLICRDDQLSTLSSFPTSLYGLDCSYNLLTEIPELPTRMGFFDCSYNRTLRCLPRLNTIYQLYFDSTAITCLQDTGIITNSSPLINSLPLCGATGCSVSTGIENATADNLKIYPNPTSEKLICIESVSEFEITVFDMSGREYILPYSQLAIDISSLAQGVYSLRIHNKEGTVTRRFVRE